VKRKKYFDEERAFEFIWQNADHDGIWHGDAASLGAEFEISEEAAEAVLDKLRTRRLIENLYTGAFFISDWQERDNPGQPDQ
jgi:hypothetical protein